MTEYGTFTLAIQAAAIRSEYNRALNDGNIALAERIREVNRDLITVDAGQYQNGH